jgi:hypothetical protein
MKKWHIEYTEKATGDFALFIQKYPAVWNEIKRIVSFLAQEDDPRQPLNSELNVSLIEHDAPGWWRVRVGKPGPFAVRLMFILLGTRNGKPIPIERLDKVDEFDDPKAIQITYASFRSDAYGKRLRDRYKGR